MDTLGYIKGICDADYRLTASEQERAVFYEPIENLINDYEKCFKKEGKA